MVYPEGGAIRSDTVGQNRACGSTRSPTPKFQLELASLGSVAALVGWCKPTINPSAYTVIGPV